MKDAATSIQLAMKNRKARNEFADKYVDELKDEYAKGKAGALIKAATKSKWYSKEHYYFVKEKRAANKIESAIQSKQYYNEFKQFQAVNKNLGPSIKQALIRDKYIKGRDEYYDQKEGNKIDTMEAQLGYIENVVKKARDIKENNQRIHYLVLLNQERQDKIIKKQ